MQKLIAETLTEENDTRAQQIKDRLGSHLDFFAFQCLDANLLNHITELMSRYRSSQSYTKLTVGNDSTKGGVGLQQRGRR